MAALLALKRTQDAARLAGRVDGGSHVVVSRRPLAPATAAAASATADCDDGGKDDDASRPAPSASGWRRAGPRAAAEGLPSAGGRF